MKRRQTGFGAELPARAPGGAEKLTELSAIKAALGSIGFLWVALICRLVPY